jgi:thiamine biosynthesis protein ThiS
VTGRVSGRRPGPGDRIVRVTLNGDVGEADAAVTLDALLRDAGIDPAGRALAVAVDREVVPRARWCATRVPDGARIEVVRPAAGGCA